MPSELEGLGAKAHGLAAVAADRAEAERAARLGRAGSW